MFSRLRMVSNSYLSPTNLIYALFSASHVQLCQFRAALPELLHLQQRVEAMVKSAVRRGRGAGSSQRVHTRLQPHCADDGPPIHAAADGARAPERSGGRREGLRGVGTRQGR